MRVRKVCVEMLIVECRPAMHSTCRTCVGTNGGLCVSLRVGRTRDLNCAGWMLRKNKKYGRLHTCCVVVRDYLW